MVQQIGIPEDSRADYSVDNQPAREVLTDVAYRRLFLVNVVYIGELYSPDWFLVDAGVGGSAAFIRAAAEERFGPKAKPKGILMTHGHFDHVGALENLVHDWDVPVYAHPLEMPYLSGKESYPPPNPSVGGGLMAALSRFYPRGPVNVSDHLRELPPDGSIPGLPAWKWIHTPGHTRGHISFWRESDRCVIAGDAFVTTAQESAYAVLVQEPEVHGPPMYFTEDWEASRKSVKLLASLEPHVAVTGHGRPMHGREFTASLKDLADRFDEVAVPRKH